MRAYAAVMVVAKSSTTMSTRQAAILNRAQLHPPSWGAALGATAEQCLCQHVTLLEVRNGVRGTGIQA